MKLIHYSKDPIERLDPGFYKNLILKKVGNPNGIVIDELLEEIEKAQSGGAKPLGFWVSVEDDPEEGWKSWCVNAEYELESLAHEYEVIIEPNSNILIIDSTEKIISFSEKFRADSIEFGSENCFRIDWINVKKEYQGIIISPYRWDCRLNPLTIWYYGWDCASGCIWDLECIEEFKLISENK
jgi:hypothetical protein